MQVVLNWQTVANALYYRIYRGTSSGGPYLLLGQSNPNAGQVPTPANSQVTTTFTDGTTINGQSYYYVVTSVTPDGESPYSAEFAAVALAQPSSPAGFTGVVT